MNRSRSWLAWILIVTFVAVNMHLTSAVRAANEATSEDSWLTALFPDPAQADHVGRRLRASETSEVKIPGGVGGVVSVELTYLDSDGREQTGRARIFVPPALRTDPHQRVPLIHNAGYECGENEAAGLLAQGYAVSTPHAHPLNPLGRGPNLDRAILHAVRQLSWVDPQRVAIYGGSAGGWMTLMLSADAFPLVWSIPMVPPVHVGYNMAFISENESRAAAAAESGQPRMPVLLQVASIARQAEALYGVPFEDPAYLAVSPLAHLDTITAPTLVTFSTADLLVPIDQVAEELVYDFDAAAFPAGFDTRIPGRFPGVNGARTLLAALDRDGYELFKLVPGPNPKRLDRGEEGGGTPTEANLPFSTGKTWSVVILDEGPVEPLVGHLKYAWTINHEAFRAWAEQQGVAADQLTLPKLTRLMHRMLGQPWQPFEARLKGAPTLTAAHQLDYPEAERADVLLGLTAFAADDARASRLASLYAQLPEHLQVLGAELVNAPPDQVRSILRTAGLGAE